MLSPATNNGNLVVNVPVSGTQGYYRLLLTNNTAVLPPTLYLGTDQASGQGVLKSTDGGNSWNIAGPAGDTINALAVNPAYPSTVYAGLNGGRDAFISTLTPSGHLYSSTYIGGSGTDQGNAIAIDVINFTDAYMAGSTASSDFPTTAVPAVVPQSKIKADDVKPADKTPQPTVTGSDGGHQIGNICIVTIPGANGCPDSKIYYVETTNGVTPIHFEPNIAGDVTFTQSGSLPNGVTYKDYHGVSYPGNVAGVDGYEIKGTPQSVTQSQEFTFTITITRGKCTWSYTYVIYVNA
jgi:hypothetical protein